jgi:hypothetical protein
MFFVARPLAIASTTLLLVATACIPNITRERERPGFGMPHDPSSGESVPMGTGIATSRAEDGPTRKRVASKEEPATLVAIDRSRCAVTEDRYRDARVGQRVTCAWRSADRPQ